MNVFGGHPTDRPNDKGGSLPGIAETPSAAEVLWHKVCDTYPAIEVATRHAYDDFELRPEDHAVLEAVADLRRSYLHCSTAPDVVLDDEYLLADIDSRLSSLEARAEILLLVTS